MSPAHVIILGLASIILGAASVLIPLALAERAKNRRYRQAFAAFAKDIEAHCGKSLEHVTESDVAEWYDVFWHEHRHDATTRERLARSFLDAESPKHHEPAASNEEELEDSQAYKRVWDDFDSIFIGYLGQKPKDVHDRVERFLSSPFVPDFVKHEFVFMLERLAQLRPTTAPHDPDASLTADFIVDRIESITSSLCKTQAIAEGWRYVIEPEIARCERAYGKLVHVKCVHDTMPSFLHMKSSEQ